MHLKSLLALRDTCVKHVFNRRALDTLLGLSLVRFHSLTPDFAPPRYKYLAPPGYPYEEHIFNTVQLEELQSTTPYLRPLILIFFSLQAEIPFFYNSYTTMLIPNASRTSHCISHTHRFPVFVYLFRCFPSVAASFQSRLETHSFACANKHHEFSPVSIQTQRTKRKRLRLDGNRALGQSLLVWCSRPCYGFGAMLQRVIEIVSFIFINISIIYDLVR